MILAGQLIPQGIQIMAREFVALQDASHKAEYDTAAIITQMILSNEWVNRAQVAFVNWGIVQVDPAADTFLVELLCRSNSRR